MAGAEQLLLQTKSRLFAVPASPTSRSNCAAPSDAQRKSDAGEPSYGVLGALLRAAYGIDFNASADETGPKLTEALAELGLLAEETQALKPFYLHVLGLGGSNQPPRQRVSGQHRR